MKVTFILRLTKTFLTQYIIPHPVMQLACGHIDS